jgi:tRNA (mo5U34)-methyltransferase
LRRVLGSRKPQPGRAAEKLELADSIPPLQLVNPEDARALYMKELRATLEWHPEGWGGQAAADDDDLAVQVGRLVWYHTLELPGGVVTPGFYDHRSLVPHYGIPASLSGKRVLDVGTWDGFWAFEFERRGGDVVALDLDRLSQTDLPPQIRQAVLDAGLDQPFGRGFEIARRALSSKVERVVGSVYDLDPADVGMFDLVHMSDVAVHLERPLEAFRRLRSVTSGSAMIVEAFHPDLDQGGGRRLTEYRGGWVDVQWWIPSLTTLAQMVLDAGFSDVRVHKIYRLNQRDSRLGQWRALLVARP